MFFQTLTVSLLLTSVCLSTGWAAEGQMVEYNRLLQKTKPKSIKLFNQTSAMALVDVAYKQVVSPDLEDDEEEGLALLIPQASYAYIISDGIDEHEFPIIKSQVLQYTTVLKKNQTCLAWLVRAFEVKPGEELGIPMHEEATIAGLRLRTDKAYVNFKSRPEAISFSIDDSAKRSFPQALSATDFVRLSTARKSSDLPAHTKAFKTDLCPSEGFSTVDFARKLQALHDANAKFLTDTLPTAAARIPLITHTIWASSEAFPEQYAAWLETTTKRCKTEDGWQHFVWTTDEHAFDDVSADLKKSISLKNMLGFRSPLKAAIQMLVDGDQGAVASKIFRHLALQKHGGVFRGTDTEVVHSLTSYHQAFDFYMGLDGFSGVTPASGLIASIPNHPISAEILAVIQRNMPPSTCPPYLEAVKGDKLVSILLGFGYGPVSIALMTKAGQGGMRDMIAPPRVFSPMRKAADILSCDDPRMQWQTDTMAIHYFDRSWAK